MIEILETSLEYIKGNWTLPWILIGFIVTMLLSRFFTEEKINKKMKKIGLILLYIFVPLLLFQILLGVDFGRAEIIFSIVCFIILISMYILAYYFANYKVKKLGIKGEEKSDFIKTVLTNQGRSSAFIGSLMLGDNNLRVLAIIYMIIGAIFLFAIIPYILSHLHKKEIGKSEKTLKIQALPWHLRIFPWYLLCFAFAAIILHGIVGITLDKSVDPDIVFIFITSLTIPAALYYVGAGIHINDIKDMINRVKKKAIKKDRQKNWVWTKNILFLTVVLTSILTVSVFGVLYILKVINEQWFAVITINSILPITSTNMFLIPYGINRKVTALSVTWTTIVCVPLVALIYYLFTTFIV